MDRLSDLEFFVLLVKHGSLAALAREQGVSPPAVTVRLARLEKRLGIRLLNRTTRSISVTHEGEKYFAAGARLLSELQELEQAVSGNRAVPEGLLRVNATFGFGQRHIAPAVVEFARRYPQVAVHLKLTDRSVNLRDKAFDIGIWSGAVPDSGFVARRIVANQRLLCASPEYLRVHGSPTTPRDLQTHQCIVLRESEASFGTWHLSRGNKQVAVRVRGMLSTNDGETGRVWATGGFGILMGSEWDIHAEIVSGQLVRVLNDWSLPSEDVYAIHQEHANLSPKVGAFTDFLAGWFNHRAIWAAARP
jgi:LysR family transcriptional regulator, transcriptional activator for dmlA